MNLPSKSLSIEVAKVGANYAIKWSVQPLAGGVGSQGELILSNADELHDWLANLSRQLA